MYETDPNCPDCQGKGRIGTCEHDETGFHYYEIEGQEQPVACNGPMLCICSGGGRRGKKS